MCTHIAQALVMRFLVISFFIFFSIPIFADASSYHKISGSLTSAGVFNYTSGVPAINTSGGAYYAYYSGTYPDTSSVVSSGVSSNVLWERHATTTITAYAQASLSTSGRYWIRLSEGFYPDFYYYFTWEVLGGQILSAGFGTESLDTVTNTRFLNVNISGTATVTPTVTYFLDQAELDQNIATKNY